VSACPGPAHLVFVVDLAACHDPDLYQVGAPPLGLDWFAHRCKTGGEPPVDIADAYRCGTYVCSCLLALLCAPIDRRPLRFPPPSEATLLRQCSKVFSAVAGVFPGSGLSRQAC
jgi:hypothetical protein